MVHHDDVDAFSAESVDFWLGVRAAIEGNEELGLRFGEHAFERGHRKSVTFLEAARDEIFRVRAKAAEEVDEHRRARDAIDVIVAQDGDTLTLGGGEDETFGSFAQATDRERVGDMGELRAEMTLRFGLVREGAGEDGG
jgi:hypothetical protein